MPEHAQIRVGRILAASSAVTVIQTLGLASTLVKDVFVAGLFGATGITDAYLVAALIPTTFLDLLLAGTLGAAFLPLYDECRQQEGAVSGYRLANSILSLVILVSISITAVGALTVSHWIRILAPGLPPAQHRVSSDLALIMLPNILCYSIAGITKAVLNAHGEFIVPAANFLVGSIITIALAAALFPAFGIHGLAFGSAAAGAIQVVIQFLRLKSIGFRFRLTTSHFHHRTPSVLRRVAPTVWIILSGRGSTLVERALASTLPLGHMSQLYFAYRLVTGLILGTANSLATVMLPAFSSTNAQGDRAQFRRLVDLSLSMQLTVGGFLLAAVLTMANPLVAFVLGRGAFDRLAVIGTGRVLIAYAPLLVFNGAAVLLNMVFYAIGDTRKLSCTAIANGLANIAFDIVFVRLWGNAGLALGCTLAAVCSTAVSIYYLRGALPGMWRSIASADNLKVLVSGIATAVAGFVLGRALGLSQSGEAPDLLVLGAICSAMLLVYAALLLWLRTQAAMLAVQWALRMRSRLRKGGKTV